MKKPARVHPFFLLMMGAGAALLIGLLIIAGSDKLFRGTVPLEQRLVSHNDDIRKKAEQELLGLAQEEKYHLTGKLSARLTDTDPFVRKWAAISIALIGSDAQEAIPTLLRTVTDSDKDVVQAARVALSEIGTPDPRQLPTLIGAMADPQLAVRCEAAASIAKMGPAARGAIPLLVREAKASRPIPDCMADALAGLITFLPDAAPPFLYLLTDSTVTVRTNAANVLTRVGPKSPDIITALLKTLQEDSDDNVRRLAARALTLHALPDRGFIPVHVAALRHAKNEFVRETALDTLQQSNPPLKDVEPVLLDALRDSSADVRYAALRWLRDADRRARFALPALRPILRDDDPRLRRLALEVLRQTGTQHEEFAASVALAQRDSEPSVRCLASELLVEMGAADRVAIPRLVSDLKVDEDDCAADALAMTGHFNGDVVPAMIDVLHGTNREAGRRAVFILMQLGFRAKSALPALAQARRDQIPGAEVALRAIHQALTHTHRRGR